MRMIRLRMFLFVVGFLAHRIYFEAGWATATLTVMVFFMACFNSSVIKDLEGTLDKVLLETIAQYEQLDKLVKQYEQCTATLNKMFEKKTVNKQNKKEGE